MNDSDESSCIICECGENFTSEDKLLKHLKNNHVDEELDNDGTLVSYKCGLCDETFHEQDECISHVNSHEVPVKTKLLVENLQTVIRTASGVKRYECKMCMKNYKSRASLSYHQRVHTGERPYECSYCPKTFTMPVLLVIHERTHTGERPYHCELCSKTFTNQAALFRHNRVHTGEKPYPCPICQKAFQQSNSMKIHVQTVHHKMPAPYKNKDVKLQNLTKVCNTSKNKNRLVYVTKFVRRRKNGRKAGLMKSITIKMQTDDVEQ